MTPRVLITGAAGLIGRILRDGLSERYALSGIDLRKARDADLLVGDMRKLRRVQPAFQDVDVVVDLASNPSATQSWDDVREQNLPATLNALEAARRAGARRLVFASSNHVTGLYERDPPYSRIVAGDYEGLDPAQIPRITARHPIRPDGPYGVGKAFGEAAGRFYAEEHGLSVLCLRIGTVNPEGRPGNEREFATLLGHRDIVELVDACIRAPAELRYGVYYGVSANTWRFWDLEDGARDLGFTPADDAETWR